MRRKWLSERGRSPLRNPGACCEAERRRRAARRKLLTFSRRLARKCGRAVADGLCTIDDVTDRLRRFGHVSGALGNTAGSVFRTEDWQLTSMRVRSRRPDARGREVKVWQFARGSHGGGRPRGRRPAAAWGLGIRVTGHAIGGRGSPPNEPLFSCRACGQVLPVAWCVMRCRKRLCLFCACGAASAVNGSETSPGHDPDQ
jgi:hypothetical protein